MEKRFKSLSLFEFQSRFPDDEACRTYLSGLKWADGYSCSHCGHGKYCRGANALDRQCTSCGYIESPTAGTLFHRLKFPILKAFHIIFYVSTCKNGISSTELSRKLELRQKTCWLFKRKVMKAMGSSGAFPMAGKVDVDETYVGGQDEEAIGRNEGKKKIVAVAIERKGKGVSRMYGRVIETASKKNLKSFMQSHISPDAEVRTDGWAGQGPGGGVSQAGGGEVPEEGQELPPASPQHHALQGLAQGNPPFGPPPPGIHRRVHLPLQPTQNEGGNLREPHGTDDHKNPAPL